MSSLANYDQPRATVADQPRLLVSIALATGVGLAYFLAVQLSFGLLTTDKVAVFWPASGVAAGVLIVLGPSARWPVVTGVMTSVVAAHVMTAKPLPAGLVSALADGAEVAIIAGFIHRTFGPRFTLSRLLDVLGLFAAGLCGIVVSAIGGLIASRLQATPAVDPALTSFIDWLASNTIGFLVVAPLVIGLAAAWRNPPPPRELLEGLAGLVVLTIMTAVIIFLQPELWRIFVPIAWLIPAFTWIAGRCRPVFVAAGVFIVCISIVWTAIRGVGHFGYAEAASSDRILEARVVIFIVTLGALFLAALFAERRESEGRLAQSNRLLERERDNKLMNLQAALASISHEIRQPLAAIALNGQAARHLLEVTPPDLVNAREALGDVVRSTAEMGHVLDDIRQLFGKGQREMEAVDVNDLARGALQLMHDKLADHSVIATLELASDPPVVRGHKVQLQEVILNLARNAVESMASVEGDARTLQLRTQRSGAGGVVIEVEDSGPGIEPAHMPNIFDAFVTTKSAGMGLGLAICREIVERHGGTLSASSNVGRGALFQVILPALAA
jgi:signal transduction histidine kinase